MDSSKNASDDNDPTWQNHTNYSANSSEWLGAVFIYLTALGRKDFNSLYTRKSRLKNSIIGTLIKLFFFAILVYISLRTWS